MMPTVSPSYLPDGTKMPPDLVLKPFAPGTVKPNLSMIIGQKKRELTGCRRRS